MKDVKGLNISYACYINLASSSGHSQIINVTRRKTGGPGTWTRVWRHYHIMSRMFKVRREAARFELQIWKDMLVYYLLVKLSNYNHLYTLEPYVRSATNASAHKTADLWPAHSRFHVGSR